MTRDQWMPRVCGDLGDMLADIDNGGRLSASEALDLAKGGAVWLLEDGQDDKTLGEAMGLAALLVIMVRETCFENEQKRAEASGKAAAS